MRITDEPVMGRVLGTDPIVTISKRGIRATMGLAGAAPGAFVNRRALHLLSMTWHCENPRTLHRLATDISHLSRKLHGNHFVVLANTEYEAYLLGRHGIPTLFANELILVDERSFVPEDTRDDAQFDAIYNARIIPLKRHELARSIDRLAFIYGKTVTDTEEPGGDSCFQSVRRLVPQARFLNHELGGGTYRYLTHAEICAYMARSRVGLCLSAQEGSMKASLEYQLCGLPVVSTPSLGGRDRYFSGPHCMIAEATPEAIAAAVRQMIERRFDPWEIRGHTLANIAFDRYNFLINVNKVIKSIFGVEDMFTSFEPFFGFMTYRPASEIVKALPEATRGERMHHQLRSWFGLRGLPHLVKTRSDATAWSVKRRLTRWAAKKRTP